MSFYGDRFIFDGVPCEEFGLMLYNVGSTQQNATTFASNSDFVEDRIFRRYDSLFYGTSQNGQLSFSLVFGLDPDKVNVGLYFDRYDFEKIASWLTGRDGYKWLQIGDDTEGYFRYYCKISDLKVIQAGLYPQCYSCTVTCNSPFAFMPEKTFSYDIANSETIIFHNRSTSNMYYYPKVELVLGGCTNFSIVNKTDNNRETALTDIPAAYAVATVTFDNQNQILTSSHGDNLYPCFNKKFFRLVRGDNVLSVTGTGTLRLICEFPVNVGG